MKKTFKYILSIPAFLLNVAVAKAHSTPTVYGVHTPVETNLGGLEWIFILAAFVFLVGLILILNGKALKSQLNK